MSLAKHPFAPGLNNTLRCAICDTAKASDWHYDTPVKQDNPSWSWDHTCRSCSQFIYQDTAKFCPWCGIKIESESLKQINHLLSTTELSVPEVLNLLLYIINKWGK